MISIGSEVNIGVFKGSKDGKIYQVHGVNTDCVQFYFNINGKVNLNFGPHYSIEIKNHHFFILYNPNKEIPFELNCDKNSIIVSLVISIKELHNLLSNQNINVPNMISVNKKYYQEEKIQNALLLVLNQIIKSEHNFLNDNLYIKAKIYEVLSLIFISNNQGSIDKCPFILNNEMINKIKLAKDLLLKNISSTPTLNELSKLTNLSLKKLKIGFKEIYGKPVYQYALDYKMETAKYLLIEGKFNVNEISSKLGYSNSSHFIAAFKKKFGVTPTFFIKNI